MAQEGFQSLDIPRFLTTDDKVLNVFFEPLTDEKGTPVVDENGRPLVYIPPKNKILYKTMLLLNSHLCRTGNMTEREAQLFNLKIKRLFLMLEAEQDENSYEGELWALYEDLKLHLEGAVRDNIGGWRGKLLTVKEWYAHLTSNLGGKKKGLLGGLFGK